MPVAVGDKLKGTMQLQLADETFFTAECQLTVIATGSAATPAAEEAAPPPAPAPAKGQAGAAQPAR